MNMFAITVVKHIFTNFEFEALVAGVVFIVNSRFLLRFAFRFPNHMIVVWIKDN